MYIPFNYEQINIATSAYTPTSIKKYNNAAYSYWERALFQRASSVLTFSGLPEEWQKLTGVKDFLLYCLLKYGYVAVSEDERGLWFNPCTLGGISFYYQPTFALVANPAFTSSKRLELGSTGALIKLTPDYRGIYDIISYYAEKLALLDCSINTGLVNSKVPYILGGKTKSVIEALKKLMDKINGGEPAVYYDTRIEDAGDLNRKDTPFHVFKLFSSSDYICDKLLEDRAKLLNAFDTEVGIQSLPFEKKERMITDEAVSKKQETLARVTTWKEALDASLAIVNDMFGTDIKVEIRTEVSENGTENNVNRNGAVSEQAE